MEGEEKGRAEGEALGDLRRSRQVIFDLLEELGDVPEDIRSRINNETDLKVLQKWLKATARAGSFNNFRSSFTE